MHGLSLIQYAAIAALPLLFAITVHEVAHGWVALRYGDRTAQMLGRAPLRRRQLDRGEIRLRRRRHRFRRSRRSP